ncbi:MAG: protein-L-isoaspartate O-methyltransferase, partial [Psychromonas sp.]|nr:protein-L-isoaspartate O-methyltransferase [Psychromonas sp.]
MDYLKLREQMVSQQIERRGIKNRDVLQAMRTVPRHQFVINKFLSEAYSDYPLPIGFAQTISQPYIVALMT